MERLRSLLHTLILKCEKCQLLIRDGQPCRRCGASQRKEEPMSEADKLRQERDQSRELGILFRPDMHRAIREGRKTETRRPIKKACKDGQWANAVHPARLSGFIAWWGLPTSAEATKIGYAHGFQPRYQVGDRLWVKEAICPKAGDDGMTMWNEDGNTYQVHYRLDDRDEEVIALDDDGGFKFNKDGTMASPWNSPMFMPKWAARTWLEVTGVRAERLHEITDEGAIAEGIIPPEQISAKDAGVWEGAEKIYFDALNQPRRVYSRLWDEINGKGSWQANPWVWVYQFKLLEAR